MTSQNNAWAINRFGGPEVFERVELEVPKPGDGEIVIKVMATSVNPVDYKIRRGDAEFLAGPFPSVLHPDAAGVVTAVGVGVAEFAIGDEVYSFGSGLIGKPGALAEYIAIDARMAAKKPRSLNFAEAAALPLVTVTAWLALIDFAQIGTQHNVLIQGGTGGVGHVAVQLAKWRSAFVAATSGTDEKARLAEELGADLAYNYRTASPEQIFAEAPGGAGYDFVFNTPGTPSVDHSVAVAKQDGTILDILGEFPTQPGFQVKWLNFKSIFAGRSLVGGGHEQRHHEILSDLAQLVEDGAIRPLLDPQRFTFDQVSEAHAHAEHGNPTGKVVIARD